MPIIVGPSRHGSVIAAHRAAASKRWTAGVGTSLPRRRSPLFKDRGQGAVVVPEIGHRSRDNAIALIGGNARTDPYRDGPAQKTKRRCAGLPVGNRSIACGARRRLERLYDRADLRAIGSTDAHLLATLTLAHWLYVRATAARL